MNRSIKVKVCGMRDKENILSLLALNPDYMGFIFYPKSKRFVDGIVDKELLQTFPNSVQKTGVFVNQPIEEVEAFAKEYSLNAIQLHGSESPAECQYFLDKGYEVIKVFSVGTSFDFNQLAPYEDVCDYFLFDTKGEHHGGHGVTFDWSILDLYTLKKPLFLSGGLDPKNIEQVKTLDLPIYAIDVNSKFEIEPALKDINLLTDSVFKTFNE